MKNKKIFSKTIASFLFSIAALFAFSFFGTVPAQAATPLDQILKLPIFSNLPGLGNLFGNQGTPNIKKSQIPGLLGDLIDTYSNMLGEKEKNLLKNPQKLKLDDVKNLFNPQGQKKVVYLTFDDGPNEPFTSQVLDILKRQNVPATFFVCGKNAERQPETLRKIKAGGHNIGNHSYTHSSFNSFSGFNIEKETDDTSALIKKYTGEEPFLYRPPYGFLTPSAKKYIDQKGYKIVLADVLAYDWEGIPPDKIKEYVLKKVRPGSIIVLHDGRGIETQSSLNSVKAVEPVIEALRKLGYSFERIEKSTDTSLNTSRLQSLIGL